MLFDESELKVGCVDWSPLPSMVDPTKYVQILEVFHAVKEGIFVCDHNYELV